MQNISLVAGGAGFIGSHLCKNLLKNGHTIICLDDLSTGSKRNIDPFLDNKNFIFINGSVTDSKVILELDKLSINEIFHLASPASVTYIMDHPVDAAQANSIGTKNLLEVARKKNAKFLFASSSEVYGDPKEHPQKETYWGNVNPIGVRSGYDEGKRFGEALTFAYHRQYDIDIRIVRIFNTYGPNSSPKDTRIIPNFVTQAIRNVPLTVHGDGTQTRSLCFVSDLVEGMMLLMESDYKGPVNLGSPDEYRVIDIAKKIIDRFDSTSKITFVQRPKDDPSRRKPDISLAQQKLNWQPKVSFEEGLGETVKYFKEII
ncbi:MAG: NAD-dependent dehydratase [Candidatus Levybacteria bacterium RIFCSPHIGHO2_01_FULL_38_26]|nr:MAG: NAD-dependent dehydratase [Candidatus Levybacteria bacterium RIFCSPHIGHO2_01_FULL_38_26]